MTASRNQEPALTVTHIINSVDRGGAELLLLRLLSQLQESGIRSHVVALTGSGALRSEFEALGVSVHEFGLSGSILSLTKLRHLIRLLRLQAPDVVQTWMYHSDLIGGLAARLARVPRVYWNIRHSNPNHPDTRLTTRLIAKASAWLSRRVPTKIICCATSAAHQHAIVGYCSERMMIINNGFDTERFAPDPAASSLLRENFAVDAGAPLIGLVARFHELKGHRTFIEAAQIHHATHPDSQFLLCGPGVTDANTALTRYIEDAGLTGRVHLLGPQNDIERIQAGLTIACSTSLDEGFSNSLGEAMACGVPCVATDVGASADIVGDTGWIVPPGDAKAIANAWSEALREPISAYDRRAEAARNRILKHYTLEQMSDRYLQLYRHNTLGHSQLVDSTANERF